MSTLAWLWLTNIMWIMTMGMVIIVEGQRRSSEYYRGLVDGIDAAHGKISLEIKRLMREEDPAL